MSERVRTTISVPEEVLEIFKRMAGAANVSVSKCMGDWLADTADAAQMVTIKMEEAKVAPLRVIREMRSLVAGMGTSVDEAEEEVRQRRAARRTDGARAGGAAPLPPSSNTGGKSPTANSKNATTRARK